MSSSNANGVSVSYEYDDLNRLSSVVDGRLSSGANTTSYTYDSASNVATVTYPNGVQSRFAYDALNRVSTLTSSVSGYSYQRGPIGNLTSAVELNGRTANWTYDGINRLTNEAITSDPSGKNGSVSYGLDPVGNRLSATSSLNGVASGSWTFDADDRISSESYDYNGNVIAEGGKSFAYDAENHLVSMNGGAVSMVYDGDGNRVAKTVSGVTTYYLVDDLNPTGYPQVVEELTGTAVSRRYTYGLQRISEDQILDSAWTPSFYGYDGGGSVRQLTNSAGAVTDTYEYDAFGNSFTLSGTTPNAYLYRGEQFDSDLGLYYLRARYYNSTTGRFVSRDPENGDSSDPGTLHKYVYAGGDPVNLSDPTGRSSAVLTKPVTGNAGLGYAGLITISTLQAFSAALSLDIVLECAYQSLASNTSAWAALGLAGNGNSGTITSSGPCTVKQKGRVAHPCSLILYIPRNEGAPSFAFYAKGGMSNTLSSLAFPEAAAL